MQVLQKRLYKKQNLKNMWALKFYFEMQIYKPAYSVEGTTLGVVIRKYKSWCCCWGRAGLSPAQKIVGENMVARFSGVILLTAEDLATSLKWSRRTERVLALASLSSMSSVL